MNKNDTIMELIDQIKNCRYLLLEINAAYLGCKPEDVILKVKEK